MAEFVRHEPCPACGSKDNLARYSDGSGYCFGCKHHEKGEEDGFNPKDHKPGIPHVKGKLVEGEYRPLKARGISAETCEFFGYLVGDFSGSTVHAAGYYRDGRLVAQKLRDKKKRFKVVGDGKDLKFFGQNKWRDSGKRIVITEGEIDAMSISQIQGNKWPVVSVPNGAQGAAKTVAREIEWLNQFEAVVFCFDNDEPGREAAQECAAILPPGKAFIASLPLKDANEMLVAGRGKELIDALWGAKAFRPDGVVDIADVTEKACQDIELGRSWPWKSLTDATYGRRRGELYGFGGGTGCGKSTVFKQIAKHVLEVDNLPVGMLMLEEPPSLTAKTLAGMIMHTRVHVPGVEYDKDTLRSTLESLSGRVFLYDHFGSMSFEVIREKIRFMVRALGVKDIFLDHLTALAAAIDDDERKAIDKIMAELSSLTQELDCTIYYISHLTTPEGKPHEEGGRVFEKHFRGSRSIAYWSHFMFGIERNKQEPDGVTTFRVLKDRYTGDSTGLVFGLCYSTETGLLDECAIPGKDDNPFSDDDLANY